jgi:putative component of toxin-antitoxin plasmid stabilization module
LELGNFSNVKGVGAGVFEYRIDFGPGYRVYFGKDGDALVILLGGGRKSARIETSQWRTCGGRTTRSASRRRRDDASHARVQGDGAGPASSRAANYREELLREGVESLLAGELDAGKAILRDYINATIGFEELSRVTKRPTKSLMRMFGPAGNPQAPN